MILTDVRARLQFRLVSLFRPHSKNEVSTNLTERLLTQYETAQMLQPHMPNRNALAWLELDRNVDPSLPFLQREGEISYRLTDVEAFVRRMSKNKSGDDTSRNVVGGSFDRRRDKDRRNGEYLAVLRERRETIDRRSGFDRRIGFERRRISDDFGYGRSGDRRGMKSIYTNPNSF